MEIKQLYEFVLLDANTLYGDLTRDLLLSLAKGEMFTPLWSDKILDEVQRKLLQNLDIDFRQTRQIMTNVFPMALVKDYEQFESEINFPDLNDKHVVAAALKSSADLIVTNDKKFISEYLDVYGLSAMEVDQFLVYIFDVYGIEAIEIIEIMRKRRKKKKLLSRLQLINHLRSAGLKDTAKKLIALHYLD